MKGAAEKERRWDRWVYGALILAGVFLFGYGLDRLPPPWWDEGWSLTIARTLVERGFYGRLLDGQLAPPGLESAFPTTWLAALGMRVFGVGLAQARIEAAVLTFGAVVLLFILTRQLYGRTVGWWLLGVLFLMTMHPQMHPLLMGRLVLGEGAMLFFLVTGFLGLLHAQKHPWLVIPLVGLSWGVALVSKGQAIPFLLLAIAAMTIGALLARQYRTVVFFVLTGVAVYASYRFYIFLHEWLRSGISFPYPAIDGVFQALVLVTLPAMRVKALELILEFCLPLALGVCYAAWAWGRERGTFDMAHWIRLGLLVFVSGWMVWFLLLANSSISRYMYPPSFIGAMFVAMMMDRFTEHFRMRRTLQRAARMVKTRRIQLDSLRALLALILLALAVPFTLLMLWWAVAVDANQNAYQTAEYLNTNTAANARIETYDTELFFFLNRPYHYPPDQMHVNYIERTMHPEQRVTYDALEADPDYLVVGPFSRGWDVYGEVLATGAFAPLTTFGDYQVYARVR